MSADATADRQQRVTDAWHKTNEEIGELSSTGGDRYRLQALLDARARLWHELATIADADGSAIPSLYTVACHYAAILDQEAAAAVRFEHHIATLLPRSEAGKQHLRTCAACGRPWQHSADGACPKCPRITWGPSPASAEEARRFPKRQPVTVWPELDGGYGVSFERPESDPVPEAMMALPLTESSLRGDDDPEGQLPPVGWADAADAARFELLEDPYDGREDYDGRGRLMGAVKLIRDRVPVNDGGREVGRAEGSELVVRLFAKLHDEAAEAFQAWQGQG